MRIIGLDIHCIFAEAVVWEHGKLKRLGRVDMRRDLLDAFAAKLSQNDIVVIEATGNAAAAAEVVAPHVEKVVIANPKQVRAIAYAKIKTDTIDAGVLAQRYASGFFAGGLDSRRAGAAPSSDAPQSNRPAEIAVEEHHPVDPACPSDPILPACRPLRRQGAVVVG